MSEIAIKLPKEKIVEGLYNLTLSEIKELIDLLIQKKLFQPPRARAINREASLIVRKKGLDIRVAEETIKWARKQKS